MTDKIIVLSTCASAEEAKRIAHRLVEKRLAACVNILPHLTSVYHWQGKVDESAEWLIIIKSNRTLFPQIKTELGQMHSYEVPEIVALPIVEGSPAYLGWMDRELAKRL